MFKLKLAEFEQSGFILLIPHRNKSKKIPWDNSMEMFASFNLITHTLSISKTVVFIFSFLKSRYLFLEKKSFINIYFKHSSGFMLKLMYQMNELNIQLLLIVINQKAFVW